MEQKLFNNNANINDRYEIFEEKGRGTYGIVYLVKDKTTKSNYAMKIFKEKTPDNQTEIEILEKISKLKNKNIINLIEYGEGLININSTEENKQYIILDYASKGELFNYIYSTSNGLKEKYAKLIFSKILKGVEALHKAGFCHRDLKMQNILLDEFYNPKICDFGYATEIQGKDGSGKLNEFLGTENYAAPEIFLGSPYDGIKVDIFSLGVILLNLVTKKIGFLKSSKSDPYYKYISARLYKLYWKKVKNQIGEISDELKDLYIKMVSFNPDERPTIDEIFKHPWMKEIQDLNESEYKILEKEVFDEFKMLDDNL